MSKKHFIALADAIRTIQMRLEDCDSNLDSPEMTLYTVKQAIADVCAASNPAFNRERWLSYIAGECGPNGGKR